MMSQEGIFLSSEADEWFKRNYSYLKEKQTCDDSIFQSINSFFPNGLSDKKVLEIGCANGYRLNWLKNRLDANILGVEPSVMAVNDGKKSLGFGDSEILVDTADHFLAINKEKFDTIVFGHSLYLVDPDNYSSIVDGVMKSLNTGGYIFIYDFNSLTQRQKYHHKQNVFSYKMQFENLFTWHPQYKLISKDVEEHNGSTSVGNCKEDCALTVIRKIEKEFAFPEISGMIEL